VKKFVNDPKSYVPEMLEGVALANPDTLKYVPAYNLIMRTDAPDANKVSIVQGSGSGHEPAHVMAVGKGMLDAACPGDVFAAPPMDYVYETAKLLNSPKGVLLLVNNYTGDRMAFDMGKEMAEADGVRCEILTINDDVAVQDSLYTVGRRGVAGNFFVIKASARPPNRAPTSTSCSASAARSTTSPARWASRSPPAPRPRRARHCSSWAPTRWSSASASTASRAASAARSRQPTRSSTTCCKRWSPTCRTRRATAWR